MPPIKNFLTVDIHPERMQYQPREEGVFTVSTFNDENKPVQAEVSFGLVDESVYSIQQDYAMNEVLADLYADTGDKRWLNLSYRFEHHSVLTPLKRHQDCLAGLHGNTQVPKLLGSLARFSYTGDPGDGFAAGFFFDRVVMHHSYATGGHGKDEYFGEPDKLSDRVDGRTAETCNVYNMGTAWGPQ